MFGAHLLVVGLGSRRMPHGPRLVAALVTIAGVGYVADATLTAVAPACAAASAPVTSVCALGEVALLVKAARTSGACGMRAAVQRSYRLAVTSRSGSVADLGLARCWCASSWPAPLLGGRVGTSRRRPPTAYGSPWACGGHATRCPARSLPGRRRGRRRGDPVGGGRRGDGHGAADVRRARVGGGEGPGRARRPRRRRGGRDATTRLDRTRRCTGTRG